MFAPATVVRDAGANKAFSLIDAFLSISFFERLKSIVNEA
jgi:hypothetical protein